VNPEEKHLWQKRIEANSGPRKVAEENQNTKAKMGGNKAPKLLAGSVKARFIKEVNPAALAKRLSRKKP
jgi:hypothetical protein